MTHFLWLTKSANDSQQQEQFTLLKYLVNV